MNESTLQERLRKFVTRNYPHAGQPGDNVEISIDRRRREVVWRMPPEIARMLARTIEFDAAGVPTALKPDADRLRAAANQLEGP